jgi:hypothetical protein
MIHSGAKGRSLALALSLVCWTTSARCATLSGKVTAGGQALAEAWVQLNTGLVTKTDVKGRFSFAPIPRATYAVQVFAPGHEPLVVGDLVAGEGTHALQLEPSDVPLGLVHVKATRADRGTPCPVRLAIRWRAQETEAFAPPGTLEWASTLDSRGDPIALSQRAQLFLHPRGAYLWSGGEAVLALPAGEAELTCTCGPLMRVAQQTVPVSAGQVAELEMTMEVGAALREAGWVSGVADCRVSSPDGRYLTNLPLAAAICRGEGLDWVTFSQGFGSDPAQGDPAQVAHELTTEECQVWVSPDAPRGPWGGAMVTLGAAGADAELGTAPHYYQAAATKRSVSVYTHALRTGPEDYRDGSGRSAFRDLATQMPFDLLADPSTVPALDLCLTAPDHAEHFRLWTLLLNQGFRLGAVSFADACIDTGDLPVAERVFVHASLEGGPAALVEGIGRGATFVSSGPIVTFGLADFMPGEAVPADDTARIAELDAWLGCVPGGGVSRLELVRAGEVVRAWDISEVGPNHVQARIAIRERDPTWFVLIAHGATSEAADDHWIASTSPWYFRTDAREPRQVLEGQITGRVTDSRTGQPIPDARVRATNPQGGQQNATTGADGRYQLTAPVICRIEATHPRYQRIERPMTADGGPREGNSTKFVAWDCPEVFALLRLASPEDLLDWAYYARLREAMLTPRLDFSLTPRK